MKRFSILILITISLLAGACSGRKSKAAHRNIIPEKDLISILSEIHLADGLLSLPQINYLYSDRDTIAPYVDIILKYGYTKAEMDQTMRYYYIRNPKKLIEVYDKVLGKLSEMDALVDKELPSYRDNIVNLWKERLFYYLPDNLVEDSLQIDFPVNYPGAYHLKFTITIYPDDQTVNPRAGIFYCFPDTATNCKRNYLSEFPFIKDGRPHTFNFLMILGKTYPVRLKGWFIEQEGQDLFRNKHFRVENIVFSRGLIQ